ncbi:MAG: WYL domain-containing protein [Victivallales bacterium]|nr:WYL domain-containing protein [Victivallales bacterium]
MPLEKQQRERLNCLLGMMKANRYPNHTSVLQEMQKADPSVHFVSKTIQRDVEYLKVSYGAPIEYDNARRGYYLTIPNWIGFDSLLDEEEMEAAAIGAHLAEAIFPPSEIQSRIRQGTDALWTRNTTSDDQSYAILQALVASGSAVKVNPEIFQTVFEQWRSQHNVTITYQNAKADKPRTFTIEPHVMALYNNIWYVHGRLVPDNRDSQKGIFMNFALHRIQGAKRDGRLFVPDYLEIAKVNRGQLFNFPLLSNVRLRIKGLAKTYAADRLPLAKVEEEPDGSAVVTLEEIEEYRVLYFVLTLNGEADILEPASLKEKARSAAENVIRGLG